MRKWFVEQILKQSKNSPNLSRMAIFSDSYSHFTETSHQFGGQKKIGWAINMSQIEIEDYEEIEFQPTLLSFGEDSTFYI